MLEKDFLFLCDQALQNLAAAIEEKDDHAQLDVDYSDGILSIEIEENGQQYVINRNSASQKIWYSSPISGADYFSFDEDRKDWIDKNGKNLSNKLFAELSQFGI